MWLFFSEGFSSKSQRRRNDKNDEVESKFTVIKIHFIKITSHFPLLLEENLNRYIVSVKWPQGFKKKKNIYILLMKNIHYNKTHIETRKKSLDLERRQITPPSQTREPQSFCSFYSVIHVVSYLFSRYTTSRYVMSRYVMLRCATLCYTTLRYATLRYATLCYATLFYMQNLSAHTNVLFHVMAKYIRPSQSNISLNCLQWTVVYSIFPKLVTVGLVPIIKTWKCSSAIPTWAMVWRREQHFSWLFITRVCSWGGYGWCLFLSPSMQQNESHDAHILPDLCGIKVWWCSRVPNVRHIAGEKSDSKGQKEMLPPERAAFGRMFFLFGVIWPDMMGWLNPCRYPNYNILGPCSLAEEHV